MEARRTRSSSNDTGTAVRVVMSPQSWQRASSLSKLAPRPAVALGAVAIARITGIGTSKARGPAPVRFAAVCLECCRGVAPVAGGRIERCDRGAFDPQRTPGIASHIVHDLAGESAASL
eukprot:7382237-Prymnesium_polylepis.4